MYVVGYEIKERMNEIDQTQRTETRISFYVLDNDSGMDGLVSI